MAKPICMVFLPIVSSGIDFSGSIRIVPEKEPSEKVYDYNTLYPDYYWFFFAVPGIKVPEIKVYNDNDFTDAKYEELKVIVENILKP